MTPAGYEVLSELGAGAWGTVVLARQVALDRLVAVKSVLGGALAGPDALERFRREAQALAALNHPAVVRVYDLLTADDDLLLVMEHVPGRSLREVLDTGSPSYPERVAVLGDVAAALTAAAAGGVVHRDVKPANVLVRDDGRAKLADFGLARLLENVGAYRTTAVGVTGSPAYLSPEQASGATAVGPAADAYSFGVLAYEVLVGALPFDGRDTATLLRQHREEPPQPVPATLPRAVARVLRAALDKEPARRAAPAEVAGVLGRITSWPDPPTARAAAPVAAVAGTQVGTHAPTSPTRPVLTASRATAPVRDPGPLPSVEPPVFDPGRRRRRSLLWAVPVVVAASLLALQARSGHALQVTGVRVVAAPTSGRCPSATFDFRATVATNGRAGDVRVRWQRPDGTAGEVQTLHLPAGTRTAQAELRFTVTGSRSFVGSATVEVAGRTAAAPIRYGCP